MNKNRFFNFVVIIALAVMAALTINQVAAANRLVSGASDAPAASSGICSAPGVERSSIHTEYDSERGVWVISTEDGPTGVDGGLIQLLNDRQACSQ